mgnify:CR=1 FL=1
MFMKYLYGEFSTEQIQLNAKLMHSEVHKLLLYKDKNVTQEIFSNDEDFQVYFKNLLYRFGGLNELLNCPTQMVALIATLQSAYDLAKNNSFNYCEYRRLILNAHNYIKIIFEEMEERKCPH